MQTPIEPEDIREGDLIRWEISSLELSTMRAVEYIAQEHQSIYHDQGQHYLLDRPEPPFEPYWGMVIGFPTEFGKRAVYLPNRKGDQTPWIVSGYESTWQTDEWAKQKLAGGWEVIEKPEGVK